MTRLIPGKTKVQVELFHGVRLGDVIVAAFAVAMLIFVLISNLPFRYVIAGGIALIAAFLLIRIDEQPNYSFLVNIISHFGYDRKFARYYNDQMLMDRSSEEYGDLAFEEVFRQKQNKRETRAEKKARLAAEKKRKEEYARDEKRLKSKKTPEEVKQAILRKRQEDVELGLADTIQKTADSVSEEPKLSRKEKREQKREQKAQKKARIRRRKEEDRILKSKTAPLEEKDAIRARRAAETEEYLRKRADLRDAAASRKNMGEIMGFTAIEDGLIVYGKHVYYGAVIEIDPVEFRFFSQHRRQNSIEAGFGRVLRTINAKYSANIVKLERPIRYDAYLEREYDKLYELRASYESAMLNEEELQARVEVEYDRINKLRSLCSEDMVITSYYYIVLYESDKRLLENQINAALSSLTQGEMQPHRLDNKELALFLKYSNCLDFDEHEIEKIRPEDYAQWAQPEVVDIKARTVEVNHVVTHNFRVVNYPSLVGDAWLAGVLSLPGTKVVVKARPMDRQKAVRSIDRSLTELRSQWSATGVDSRRMEIEQHINTLGELLSTLQGDNESLLEVNIYITAYDIVATRSNPRILQPGASSLPTITEMKKTIRRTWREAGFRVTNMEFDQVAAFIGSQVNGYDPMLKKSRGIPSNTVAAGYPWIYAHISDEGGVMLGENDGIPVFIDFFRRDAERVNSNMVIVGKSGSGKSFAAKTILTNLAADDAKIFVLDPENEYTELAGNLHGKIINVGNAMYGRLNPFHIITALDDDEAGEGAPSGSYATHLQFLEEFFRQILPDCDKDSMEYLNSMVDRLYARFQITPETNLARLRPEDYPIFDDLYDAILAEFQNTDNQYIRTMLRTLMNYVAKFSTGGRNANIWNGPSTVTTDTNFTVFNFQSMLANRNTTIANAQMLLVLKYIDNEIIKNRDYNLKYGLHRKIVVVIDEAHVFIDTKFPIALDFMFQLAKRIRKYNGMQIVITQNIKDFVGSEEIARKSTAIINACQYSFIFSLAPNDIQDLVKLYENAGGINENEQEQIVQAPRGQAFCVMSATSRSTFQLITSPSVQHMFEDRTFASRYFVGEEGERNWNEFVAESRKRHIAAAFLAGEEEREELTEEDSEGVAHISFSETSGEEYDSRQAESDRLTVNERAEPLPTLAPDMPVIPKPEPERDTVDRLAEALIQSFKKAAGTEGVELREPLPENYEQMLTELRRVEDQFGREREELRREREELRSLMNQLRSAPAQTFVPAELQPEETGRGGFSAEIDGGRTEQGIPTAAVGASDDEEAAPPVEIDWAADEPDGAQSAEKPSIAAPDAEEPEEQEEQEETQTDGSGFLSFIAQAIERANSMTVEDRMRQDGEMVADITLEELELFIKANRR